MLVFVVLLFIFLAALPVFPLISIYLKKIKIKKWKLILTACYSFCLVFFCFSLLWRKDFIIFSEQYFALEIGCMLGGFVMAFYLNKKWSILITLMIFIVYYFAWYIYFFSQSAIGWNWFIKMPFNVCDIAKIFLLIYVILRIFDKQIYPFMLNYLLVFCFLGALAYAILGMHLNKPFINVYTFESITVHASYFSLTVFLFLKKMTHPNASHSLLNVIWIVIIYIPLIFLNQIYNYYFMFTWRMTNHWREGSNPLNPIYNLLKPLSFNVGDYVSQYISPNIDSTYGQHYPFEINILFYLIVIFVLCGVLYGCNWLLKKLIKYVDYLDIASFN